VKKIDHSDSSLEKNKKKKYDYDNSRDRKNNKNCDFIPFFLPTFPSSTGSF